VRFALAEPEVARLPGARVGADAEIRLILGDGSTYPGRGRLNFAESRIDQRLGTRQLRAEFDNPSDAAGGRLLPGQFVRVVVSVNRQQPVFLVPQSAVLQTDKGYVVMTLDAENKVAPRPVQVGEWSGSDWIIQSGLKPGDRVVVDNLMKLQPGVTVSPIADQAANGAPAQQQNAAGAPGQQPANGDPAAKGEASAGAKK
jgi:membrane fusion protein (multidrug efflux system)